MQTSNLSFLIAEDHEIQRVTLVRILAALGARSIRLETVKLKKDCVSCRQSAAAASAHGRAWQ